MKYQVAASFLTFVIGVAISLIVMTLIARVPQMESPPCRDCARLYASAEIPSLTVSELKANLEQCRGKLVRVSAVFQHDAGQVNLITTNSGIHAGLSDSCASCAGARKALSIYSGFGTWYDGGARVVVVGRVGRLENPTLFPDDNGFNIDCIESVEPLGDGLNERIKYRRGELFPFVYRLNPE